MICPECGEIMDIVEYVAGVDPYYVYKCKGCPCKVEIDHEGG